MKEVKDMTEAEIRRKAEENAHVFLVQSLAGTLLYCKKNYYNGFKTVVDESYDVLERELKVLCPSHPVLEAVGDAPFEGNWLGIVATRELVHKDFPVYKPQPVIEESEDLDFLGEYVEGEDLL